jgi:hypothetical protein
VVYIQTLQFANSPNSETMAESGRGLRDQALAKGLFDRGVVDAVAHRNQDEHEQERGPRRRSPHFGK